MPRHVVLDPGKLTGHERAELQRVQDCALEWVNRVIAEHGGTAQDAILPGGHSPYSCPLAKTLKAGRVDASVRYEEVTLFDPYTTLAPDECASAFQAFHDAGLYPDLEG